MKMISLLRCAGLATLAWFVVSCAPLTPQAAGPRFHEAGSANVVLLYSSEQSIFITKPDTRENGFLPILSRGDVLHSVARPEIGRDLAVVVMGFMSPENQAALIQSWQADLSAQGFRRIVCLAGNGESQIDGLLVLRDSAIAMRDVAPDPSALTVAAIAPAP